MTTATKPAPKPIDVQSTPSIQPKWRGHSFWLTLVALLVALLPAIPLLDLKAIFLTDWSVHLWLTNYTAEYFRHHLQFPQVINTHELVGITYPIFYGYLFFPIMSMLSLDFDANTSFRIAALAVWMLQFVLFYKLTLKFSQNRLLAFAVASSVVWAIYPMTNFYNRGAVPEFFATAALFAAAAFWFFALSAERDKEQMFYCNATVLAFTLAAGTHPITAVYGTVYFALLLLVSAGLTGWSHLKRQLNYLIVPAIVGLICLSPWLYCMKKFGTQVKVCNFAKVVYFPQSLDAPLTRFAPLPTAPQDAKVVPPHLDMQMSIPLLSIAALILFALARKRELGRNRLTASLVALCALTAATIFLSVSPGSLDCLGLVARSVQFAYRLITYINLSLLMAVLCALGFRRDRTQAVAVSKPLLLLVIALAASAAAIKVQHAIVVRARINGTQILRCEPDQLLRLPGFGNDAYAILDHRQYKPLPGRREKEMFFPVATGAKFGKVDECYTPVKGKIDLLTNVQSFPWNQIRVDHKKMCGCQLRVRESKIVLPHVGQVLNQYKFVPYLQWKVMDCIAKPLCIIWLIATVYAARRLLTTASIMRKAEH